MNKLLSKIAIAIASFAMVIGGVSVTALFSKEKTKPVYADGNNVVASLDSDTIVNYGYGEWVRTDWKLSWGGDYYCGFKYNEWKTIDEQGYSKYVDGTVVTGDSYGFVIASLKPLSYVGGFDFLTSYENRNSKLYLTYSTDGESYSLVPFSSGEQGTGIRSDDVTLSFSFQSIRSAYYAIIVVSTYDTAPSNTYFQFKITSNFYEVIDPNAERITVSGQDTVYVDEEIELATTLYNFNPSELIWTSSDPSVATITPNGNTATIRGLSKGTTSITISATGSNGLVYTDPFVINVKEFKAIPDYSPVNLVLYEEAILHVGYQDRNGSVIVEERSIDDDIIHVDVSTYFNESRLYISAKDIGGVSHSFDVVFRDNSGEEGYHESIVTIQVNISAKHKLADRMTSLPNSLTPIYLGTIDGSHYITKVSTSSLGLVDNIEDAFVFFMDNFGRIHTVPGDFPNYHIFNNGQYYVISSQATSFSILNDKDEYPGMLISGNINNRLFMYADSQGAIRHGNLNSFDSLKQAGTISPSNVICAYEAIEVDKGIYPSETSVDLHYGESSTIDATLVFVSDVDYEIISGEASIDSVDIAPITNYTETSVTITASNVSGTAVIRIKDAADDSVYTDITVVVKVDAEVEVSTLSTQTKLAYHYSKDELDNFTYLNASIRFGGKINKDIWNAIDEDYGIAGFGVMITNKVVQSLNPAAQNYLIKQHVNDAIPAESATDLSTQLVNHYMSISEMAVPPESGDDYVWNLMQSITINNAFDALREYTAAAYIKLSNDDYLFFGQVTTSAYELANDYLNGEYDETSAGGSLKNIVDMVDNMLN